MAQKAHHCCFIFLVLLCILWISFPILLKPLCISHKILFVFYKLLHIFCVTLIHTNIFSACFTKLFFIYLKLLCKICESFTAKFPKILLCKIFKKPLYKIFKILLRKILRNSGWKRGWWWDCLASRGVPHSDMRPCLYGAVQFRDLKQKWRGSSRRLIFSISVWGIFDIISVFKNSMEYSFVFFKCLIFLLSLSIPFRGCMACISVLNDIKKK